ncbi:MAG TPA: beta-ketoacyl synthase N-terminal-like domain-containing protein [Candidatus Acidoferrales bacterium]|nr:beta-ketoacyl synthase N-terminal-like domain-containing protein [Candidatus Acidoferrales bacterium]
MKETDAVITGLGLATPLGNGVEVSWGAVKAQTSGIRHVPRRGVPDCFQYAGRVDEIAAAEAGPASLAAQKKFLNRGALLGLAAAGEAVSHAGIRLEAVPPERRALFIASGDFTRAGCDSFYPAFKESTDASWSKTDADRLNRATLSGVTPFVLLESIANNLFSYLSACFEFRGPNTSLASLSPYGSQALELACRVIEQRRADVALVVGYCSWVNDIALYELEGLGLLSKCRSGAASFRPFDRARDGFIPGEGGAALFLEAETLARRRAAATLARVRGSANRIKPTLDLGVAPNVTEETMRAALEEARREPKELAFVCGHGSATSKGDRSELGALGALFHDAGSAPVCGLKSYCGHMGAASDLAEIVWSIKAVAAGLVPGTLNFRETEADFSGVPISARHRPTNKRLFLSSSYGMGGQSSAIVIEVEP